MHFKSSLMLMLTVAILFGSIVTTVGFPTMTRVLAYESSQAGSLANACGNGEEPFNILCQNLLSQIEGDGNAVNIIGLQTGGERTTTPPEPPTTATLIVKKLVVCDDPQGRDCPNLPSPSDFEIQVSGNPTPIPPSAEGSATGTSFILGPGAYVASESRPLIPTGLEFVGMVRSVDCDDAGNGPIQAGETRTCTITNTYQLASPP